MTQAIDQTASPRLKDLPTPCLVLDVARLRANAARMSAAARRSGVRLRPHMKTAKSIDVARIVTASEFGGIAVSTLREAEYFAQAGVRDIQYAVGIVADKLDRAAALIARGVELTLVTDNVETARAIAERGAALGCVFPVLVEIDSGEKRAGVLAESEALIAVGRALAASAHVRLAGVMTHAGQSYGARSPGEIAAFAERERWAVVTAAWRLRDAGMEAPTVSMGSSPTALHAATLEGVTELRAGVYMFGDMAQAQIGSCAPEDLAVSVLAQIAGQRPEYRRVLVDAGALALSKDRSTQAMPLDIGFGLIADVSGAPLAGPMCVERAYQEHGEAPLAEGIDFADLPLGRRVRIYPNHVCMTAAMYDRYHVVDSASDDPERVIAVWPRINGW